MRQLALLLARISPIINKNTWVGASAPTLRDILSVLQRVGAEAPTHDLLVYDDGDAYKVQRLLPLLKSS